MSFVRDDINHFIAKIKWKLHFRNATSLGKYTCGMDNISIGRGTYGPISVLSSDPNPSLSIGSYCSIAQEVTFIIRDDHPLDRFSTYPFRAMTLGENVAEATGDGSIVVEDDVWIGYRSTVLDGVRIGRGGGRRCRLCCHQGCSALHDCWRSARTAHQEALLRSTYQLPHARRLREGRYCFYQKSPRGALCASASLFRQGAGS